MTPHNPKGPPAGANGPPSSVDTDDELLTWMTRPEKRAMFAALKALEEAIENERGINADDSEIVARAQDAVNAALADLLAATGADKPVLRQVAGFALRKRRASDAEVERLLAGIEADPNAASGAQRRIIRAMTAKAVTLLGLLPHRITAMAAWSLFLGASGRKAVPGEVWRPEPTAGVDADSGPVETCRTELVAKVGYTVGLEGLPSTHRLTASILSRALAAWDAMSRRSRFRLPQVRSRTIRKWCSGEQFDLACKQGADDRKLNRTDPSRLL